MNVKPLLTEAEATELLEVMKGIQSTPKGTYYLDGKVDRPGTRFLVFNTTGNAARNRIIGKLDKALKKYNAEETVKTYLMEKEYDVPAEERTVGDDEFQMCAKLVPLKVKAIRKLLDREKDAGVKRSNMPLSL